MDLHRRRSVLVRMTEDGPRLGTARITNSAAELRREIARAGKAPKVVLEATFGWYWAADKLAAAGAEVHLAHPLGVKAFTYRRVKNDERDSADLADLCGWAGCRRRGSPRTRYATSGRSTLQAQTGAPADQLQGPGARRAGQARRPGDLHRHLRHGWVSVAGRAAAPQPYAGKVTSLRHLAGELSTEITMLSEVIASLLAGDRGYQVIQQLPGIGPVLAAVITAEIGDVTRFATASCARGQA